MTMRMTTLASSGSAATHTHLCWGNYALSRVCAPFMPFMLALPLARAAACLAAIRFGWQIATLTGGAPRKFLSRRCSIKDARRDNRRSPKAKANAARTELDYHILCIKRWAEGKRERELREYRERQKLRLKTEGSRDMRGDQDRSWNERW